MAADRPTARRSMLHSLRQRLGGAEELTSQPRPDQVDTIPSGGLDMTDPFSRPPAAGRTSTGASDSIIDANPLPPARPTAQTPAQEPPAATAPRRERRMPLTAAGRPEFEPTQFAGGGDRSIGDLLIEAGDLSAEQVEQVLAHQRAHGTRFGESAVQLGLVRGESVMWALSQQHQYAYLPDATHHDLSDELVVAKHPFSEVAEAVRDARSHLLAGVLDPDSKPRRALAITSPNVGDGKTWFAANLAISLSQLGARTLLIDADLRTPRLHELFGLEDARVGLSTVLSGRVRASVQRPVRELKRLYLLPAGAVPPNPLELVQGPGFGMLMRELVGKFDHVVVDTPAAEHGADCRVIAARSGAALTIGRKGRSQLDALQALVQQLSKGHTQFAGVVMNEV